MDDDTKYRMVYNIVIASTPANRQEETIAISNKQCSWQCHRIPPGTAATGTHTHTLARIFGETHFMSFHDLKQMPKWNGPHGPYGAGWGWMVLTAELVKVAQPFYLIKY